MHIIEEIIKLRAWEWSVANNQVSKAHQIQWFINPQLAYKMHHKWAFKSLINRWQENHDYIGFIDGSWKKMAQGLQIGIGGFLINKDGHVKYVFSGPSDQCVGWEVELSALHHLCIAIRQNIGYSSATTYCITTDSSILYNYIQKNKANLSTWDRSIKCLQDINNMDNIHIVLINRMQNEAADTLAKAGALRTNMLSGWV